MTYARMTTAIQVAGIVGCFSAVFAAWIIGLWWFR